MFQIILADQNCDFRIVQRLGKIFCDMSLDGSYVWKGLLCQDRNPLKHFRAQRFSGNLVFVDLEGTEDPYYQAFGGRFKLYYYSDDTVLGPSFQYDGSKVK